MEVRDLVRLAFTNPEVRPVLLSLIQKAAWGKRPPPPPRPDDGDMDRFLDYAERYFETLHPGMGGALGIEWKDRSSIKVRSRISGNKGSLEYKVPGMTVIVTFDGDDVKVTGDLKGNALGKTFRWRDPSSGVHGGSFSEVMHYVEESLPTAKIVYRIDGTLLTSKDALLRNHRQTGTTDFGRLRRVELTGQPILDGYAGPMYNGRRGDTIELLYETWEDHRRNSI